MDSTNQEDDNSNSYSNSQNNDNINTNTISGSSAALSSANTSNDSFASNQAIENDCDEDNEDNEDDNSEEDDEDELDIIEEHDLSEFSSDGFDDIDDDDEVDMLLESFLENSDKPQTTDELPSHIEKTKSVLIKKGQDYFEPLPEGWIEVTHSSGMPIYLHKQSRVCTASKPYYLGGGSARRHELPITAVPCLYYQRELGKEEKMKEQVGEVKPNVNLETVSDHKRENWLTIDDFKKYCEKLFLFDVIKIRKFKTWAERRKHNSIIKPRRTYAERPTLPNETSLITCTTSGGSGRFSHKKDFVMNPAGKSFVCILHEFVQHRDKVQPKYHYQELKNAVTPYSATAEIDGQNYGVGYGRSKKEAKEEAARKTIEIIIPDFKAPSLMQSGDKRVPGYEAAQGLKFFDTIKIDDSRVSDLCAKAGEQSPYQILCECLKRTGTRDTDIKHKVKILKHHKNIYTMVAGDMEASAECKNKREGKQKAAQIMLKKLHPQVSSWGGLLLMYGRGSCKTPREKKEEEQKITELQSSASPNKPNYAILNKLKEEMQRLNY